MVEYIAQGHRPQRHRPRLAGRRTSAPYWLALALFAVVAGQAFPAQSAPACTPTKKFPAQTKFILLKAEGTDPHLRVSFPEDITLASVAAENLGLPEDLVLTEELDKPVQTTVKSGTVVIHDLPKSTSNLGLQRVTADDTETKAQLSFMEVATRRRFELRFDSAEESWAKLTVKGKHKILFPKDTEVRMQKAAGGKGRFDVTLPKETPLLIPVDNLTPLEVTTFDALAFDLPSTKADDGNLIVLNPFRIPEGLPVTLRATKAGRNFSGAAVLACVTAKGNDVAGTELAEEPALAVVVANAGPGSMEVTVTLPNLEKRKWFHSYYPFAKDNVTIRVVAWNGSGDVIFMGETGYFVSGRFWPVVAAFIALLVAYVVPCLLLRAPSKADDGTANSRFSPLHLVRGRRGKASLSNFQIWWWTLIVIALLVFVWWTTANLAELNETIIWLLGIAGGGSVAARATAVVRQARGQQIVATELGSVAYQKLAKWSDLLTTDGQFDLFKLQMLLFTLLTGLYVVVTVVAEVVFPEIPDELLWLMGISNGSYVAAKVASSNPFSRVAALHAQKDALSDLKTDREKRSEQLAAEIVRLESEMRQLPSGDSEIASLQEQKRKKEEDKRNLDAEIKRLDGEIETVEMLLKDALKTASAAAKGQA